MRKAILFNLFLLMVGQVAVAQELISPYEKHLFIIKKDTLPYRLLLPENYNPGKQYPMVLFLHGSGERGNDNEAQLLHGGDFFLRDSIRKNYPAIIVFPQCAAQDAWAAVSSKTDATGKRVLFFKPTSKTNTSLRLVERLVKRLINRYPISKKQLYVGGLSLGGMGTFEIVRRNPNLYAAAFAICGGADSSIAPKLKKTEWWIFHGAKDPVVDPQYSLMMVHALQKENASVKFTLYPEATHNSWDNVFVEPGLLPWLFSTKKQK